MERENSKDSDGAEFDVAPLSVVTICRNSERTIKRTLDSILGQSLYPLEYIIIDGCSTDRTLEIINDFKGKVPFPVVVISESDAGISDAFNKGISVAKGDWVHLLNSDDYYMHSDSIRLASRIMMRTEALMIAAKAGVEDVNGNICVDERLGENSKSSLVDLRINHPGCIIKREAYKRAGLYNLSFKTAMDHELFLRFEKVFGRNIVEILDFPFVVIGFGGESIVNARRGYREVAAAHLIHTQKSFIGISIRYILCSFFFTHTAGKFLWRWVKLLKNVSIPAQSRSRIVS